MSTLQYVFARLDDPTTWTEFPQMRDTDTADTRFHWLRLDPGFVEKFCVGDEPYMTKLDRLVGFAWDGKAYSPRSDSAASRSDRETCNMDILLATQCMELILEIRPRSTELMYKILGDDAAILPMVPMTNELHPGHVLVYDTDGTFINDRLCVLRIATGNNPVPHSVRLNRQLMVSRSLATFMCDQASVVAITTRPDETTLAHSDNLHLVRGVREFGPKVPLGDIIHLTGAPRTPADPTPGAVLAIDKACMSLVAQYAMTLDTLFGTSFIEALRAGVWQPLKARGTRKYPVDYAECLETAISKIDRRLLGALGVVHESTDAMRNILYVAETTRMEIYRKVLYLLYEHPFDHVRMHGTRPAYEDVVARGLDSLAKLFPDLSHLAIVVYLENELTVDPEANPNQAFLDRVQGTKSSTGVVWDAMRERCISMQLWDPAVPVSGILKRTGDGSLPGFLHALWMARLDPMRAQAHRDHAVQQWVARAKGAAHDGVLGALHATYTVAEVSPATRWMQDAAPCLVMGLSGDRVLYDQWLAMRRPGTNTVIFVRLFEAVPDMAAQFVVRVPSWGTPGQVVACSKGTRAAVVVSLGSAYGFLNQITIQVIGSTPADTEAVDIKPMIRVIPSGIKADPILHADLVHLAGTLYYIVYFSTMAIVFDVTGTRQLIRCTFTDWRLLAMTPSGSTYKCVVAISTYMVVASVERLAMLETVLDFKSLRVAGLPLSLQSDVLPLDQGRLVDAIRSYRSFATEETLVAIMSTSTLRKDLTMTVFKSNGTRLVEAAKLHANELPVHLEQRGNDYVMVHADGTWNSSLDHHQAPANVLPVPSLVTLLPSKDDSLIVVPAPDATGRVLVKSTRRP